MSDNKIYHRELMFRYLNWLRYALEVPMLSEVNKVFKDNPNIVSSLCILFQPPVYFDPPV